MRRRTLLLTAIAAALPAHAWAQSVGLSLRQIEPENALEAAFVGAFRTPDLRPAFRRQLVESPVALAMAGPGPDAGLLEVTLTSGGQAVPIFTSPDRMDAVLGAHVPRLLISGREALTRCQGKHVVLNYRLLPMLTLEPEDLGAYLSQPTPNAVPARPAPAPRPQ